MKKEIIQITVDVQTEHKDQANEIQKLAETTIQTIADMLAHGRKNSYKGWDDDGQLYHHIQKSLPHIYHASNDIECIGEGLLDIKNFHDKHITHSLCHLAMANYLLQQIKSNPIKMKEDDE